MHLYFRKGFYQHLSPLSLSLSLFKIKGSGFIHSFIQHTSSTISLCCWLWDKVAQRPQTHDPPAVCFFPSVGILGLTHHAQYGFILSLITFPLCLWTIFSECVIDQPSCGLVWSVPHHWDGRTDGRTDGQMDGKAFGPLTWWCRVWGVRTLPFSHGPSKSVNKIFMVPRDLVALWKFKEERQAGLKNKINRIKIGPARGIPLFVKAGPCKVMVEGRRYWLVWEGKEERGGTESFSLHFE